MMYLISIILLPLAFATPLFDFHQNLQLSYINVPLVTFDGEESTTFKFHELNDPVMVRIYIAFRDFQSMIKVIPPCSSSDYSYQFS